MLQNERVAKENPGDEMEMKNTKTTEAAKIDGQSRKPSSTQFDDETCDDRFMITQTSRGDRLIRNLLNRSLIIWSFEKNSIRPCWSSLFF